MYLARKSLALLQIVFSSRVYTKDTGRDNFYAFLWSLDTNKKRKPITPGHQRRHSPHGLKCSKGPVYSILSIRGGCLHRCLLWHRKIPQTEGSLWRASVLAEFWEQQKPYASHQQQVPANAGCVQYNIGAYWSTDCALLQHPVSSWSTQTQVKHNTHSIYQSVVVWENPSHGAATCLWL